MCVNAGAKISSREGEGNGEYTQLRVSTELGSYGEGSVNGF